MNRYAEHGRQAADEERRERCEPSERRGQAERRRSAQGLFELRARREGVAGDRRRQGPGGRWRSLWQRLKRR